MAQSFLLGLDHILSQARRSSQGRVQRVHGNCKFAPLNGKTAWLHSITPSEACFAAPGVFRPAAVRTDAIVFMFPTNCWNLCCIQIPGRPPLWTRPASDCEDSLAVNARLASLAPSLCDQPGESRRGNNPLHQTHQCRPRHTAVCSLHNASKLAGMQIIG